ncbi:MAG: hypothetical protein ACRDHI_11135 [Actinomycetota bacterium]
MRRIVFPAIVVVLLAACGAPADDPLTRGSGSSRISRPTSGVSPTPAPTEQPSPSAAPSTLPDGVPATFDEDLPARELPVDELVPPGDDVTGVDRGATAQGEVVVISFATPGPDPFTRARGFVVWRRNEGADPPWRAAYGLAHGRRDGVLAISADTTDLTGDGSDDALIREETGGSGACATYRVVDLSIGGPIWKRDVCDAEIQPNPDPIGLFEVARIYGPEDPHCCPSSIRERVLAWNGDGFAVVSEELTPL